ncbi:hypothetical protein D3C85_949530 [compost metagenome]
MDLLLILAAVNMTQLTFYFRCTNFSIGFTSVIDVKVSIGTGFIVSRHYRKLRRCMKQAVFVNGQRKNVGINPFSSYLR